MPMGVSKCKHSEVTKNTASQRQWIYYLMTFLENTEDAIFPSEEQGANIWFGVVWQTYDIGNNM